MLSSALLDGVQVRLLHYEPIIYSALGGRLCSFLCLSTLGKWVSITEHESVEIGYWSHGNPNNDLPLSILSQIYRLARDPYLSWAGDRSSAGDDLCTFETRNPQISKHPSLLLKRVTKYITIDWLYWLQFSNPNQTRIIKSRATISFHGNWVPVVGLCEMSI